VGLHDSSPKKRSLIYDCQTYVPLCQHFLQIANILMTKAAAS